ncbi:MAG: M23 family metallopeptidase [Bacteroidia bacterium]|jgi:murein DD-endopeptidase MepM/ murein hydrolase activator NlpD|nr:M23 family metallopeptidase [Bacteroidia bacterium]
MSETKNSRWKIFTDQLRNKYRLVILNDDSFAEKFSLRLSPLGLIILLGSVTIVMTTLVISLVAFTPFREYIPGYGNVDDRKDIIILSAKADSLEKTLVARDWYINNLLNVFSGKTEGRIAKPAKDSTGKYANIDIKPSEQDEKLRNDIETNQLESTSDKVSANKLNALSNYFFFTPVNGVVTTSYNIREEHFGTDIVSKENEFVKATLDGTIVFAGFTKDDGYVVQIQHGNNLTSVYKHQSSIIKKSGDFVKAGEPIGIVGNTGENSRGPHLHFEIWYNGFAINPQDYVAF